jgi:exopolyphosphatase / guanosine-5'-triphosphate,3'-diphosphate pyrophosphatase
MPHRAPHQLEQTPLAVIDIGSNSVRMVVYDTAHHPPEKIFNEKVICPLGRDLSLTGKLNPDAAHSAFKALQAYKLLSELYHTTSLLVVGTAALRDASDGMEFIHRVQSEIGIAIRVLSGDEEAGYAARGVLMFDPSADGVVADFGGGSLELARIYGDKTHDTISLPMGAYRVLAMGDRGAENISDFLNPISGRFGNLKNLYAIGGSWRLLALAYMRREQKMQELQGYTISTPVMIQFCKHILTLDEQTMIREYRMEEHQAKLSHVAAFTLKTVLELLYPNAFIVSTAGVRDGVAHEFLLSQAKTK